MNENQSTYNHVVLIVDLTQMLSDGVLWAIKHIINIELNWREVDRAIPCEIESQMKQNGEQSYWRRYSQSLKCSSYNWTIYDDDSTPR